MTSGGGGEGGGCDRLPLLPPIRFFIGVGGATLIPMD